MKKEKLHPVPWLSKKTTLVSLLTVVLFLSFFKTLLFAQYPLTIGRAPASEKLQLQPGDRHEGEIVIWNLSEKSTKYHVVIRGFRQVQNQPGTAIMLTESEEERTLYSASSWVTVSREEIDLVPNKNEKIFYSIDVPLGATKGEYYVIIAFLSETEYENIGTAAFTVLGSGTPILIKIGDEFVERAELISFETDRNFYEFPNIKFETKLNNIGDTHITPMGDILLTNIFNQQVGTITFNAARQSILRENTGIYETDWDYGSFLTTDRKLILGPIKADLMLTYRASQPGFAPLTAETSFWVLPWKYILIAILVITVIIIIWVNRRKRKKEERKEYLPK
ncbi:MAG: hypothetical protein WCY00_00085 [Candidatus Dojkabacteria bacterium]